MYVKSLVKLMHGNLAELLQDEYMSWTIYSSIKHTFFSVGNHHLFSHKGYR